MTWNQRPSEGHKEQSSVEEETEPQLSTEPVAQPEDPWVLGSGFWVLGQVLVFSNPQAKPHSTTPKFEDQYKIDYFVK